MLSRWPVCGSWVNLLTQDRLLDLAAASRHGQRFVLANHNLHSLHLIQRDLDMQSFYAGAAAIHIDGMPIVAMARLLGAPARPCHRQTSADFLLPMLGRLRDHRRRVFILGGTPTVLADFLSLARDRVPGIAIAGHHGFFANDAETVRTIPSAICGFAPDLLLLGMGMPLQERWYVANRPALPACTVMNLGAFMDYWVGAKSLPPRRLAACGLEWAWRLGSEPRRLWRRYLLEPLLLAEPFARHRRRIRWGSAVATQR